MITPRMQWYWRAYLISIQRIFYGYIEKKLTLILLVHVNIICLAFSKDNNT